MNSIRILAGALALAVAAPGAAGAEPFTLFIFETPDQLALREAKTADGAAYWESWSVAAKAMADAGVVRGGSALMTGEAAGRTGGGEAASLVKLSGGPLALGGYFQIDVPDAAAALEWAAKLPVADGLVEVRAGYPVPGGM